MVNLENRDRLVEMLNDITYEYAPDRGVTAEYIAMMLDCRGVVAPKPVRMTDQQQRTQWALDLFNGFVRDWTPPVMQTTLLDELTDTGGKRVRDAIRAISPKDDNEPIGYGVFKREIDADWDQRQHPSGYVHELVSAVFDKPAHAENAHQSACKRHPDQHYVICEIREIP